MATPCDDDDAWKATEKDKDMFWVAESVQVLLSNDQDVVSSHAKLWARAVARDPAHGSVFY